MSVAVAEDEVELGNPLTSQSLPAVPGHADPGKVENEERQAQGDAPRCVHDQFVGDRGDTGSDERGAPSAEILTQKRAAAFGCHRGKRVPAIKVSTAAQAPCGSVPAGDQSEYKNAGPRP